MSFVLLVEQAAPETPSANQVVLYPKSDGRMYSKDDTGTERGVSASAGATTDNAIARYDGTAGALQNSGPTISDTNDIAGVGDLSAASISGGIVATQANQETGTSIITIVTPGRQHFHPSAPKAWLQCGVTGNVTASYGVTSVTDTGTGVATVNLSITFSSGNYAPVAGGDGGGGGIFVAATNTNVTSFTMSGFNTLTQAAADPAQYDCAAFGDL